MFEQAMIMAAGLGTRAAPFTEFIPKPLLPILGIPSIEFHIQQLAQAGVKKIVFNAYALYPQMLSMYETLKKKYTSLEIILSDEREQLLGGAGGIKKALCFFDPKKTLLVLNADTLAEYPFRKLYQQHQIAKKKGCPLTLTLVQKTYAPEKYSQVGIDLSRKQVLYFGQKASSGIFFSGLYAVEPFLFNIVPPDKPAETLKYVFLPWMKKRKVSFLLDDFYWQDIGSAFSWHYAHISFMEYLEKKPLEGFKELIDSVNIKIANHIWIHQKCNISEEILHTFKPPLYLACPQKVLRKGLGPYYIEYGPLTHQTSYSIGWGGIKILFSEKDFTDV